AAVRHFFTVLRLRRPADLSYGDRLLTRLSALSPAAAKTVLQQLVEGALRRGNAELFGGTGEKGEGEETGREERGEVSLLEINGRFTAAVHFAGGVWSVFHAGVIGRGLKTPPGPDERTPEELTRNTQTFLNLLLRCCRGGRSSETLPAPSFLAINPEAAKAVAAALVENVCPEAAGGELVWPPEEQARGTVERDLRICRRFR
ncbi:INT5 protein, partial [Calonectris borealis]|nr:INT5 protein [Calonectris borealis]